MMAPKKAQTNALAGSHSWLPCRIAASRQHMRTRVHGLARAGLLLVAFLALAQPLGAQPNSWISPGSGHWQDAFNWSAGPPNAFESMFITNAGIKNVLIDNTTLGFPTTMTVSDLTVSGNNNSLLVNGTGLGLPLHIRREFDLRTGGMLGVGASALQVDGPMKLDGTNTHFDLFSGWASVSNMVIGSTSSSNCLLTVQAGGSLFITNVAHTAYVDVAQGGSLTLGGGLLQADSLILTNGGAFNDLAGTLNFGGPFQVENSGSVTISNATVTTPLNFTLGSFTGSTGTLQVLDGGLLGIAGATLDIGYNGSLTQAAGVGAVTVSRANLSATTINLGNNIAGVGSLLIQSNAMVGIAANLNVVSGSLSTTSVVTVIDGNLLANTVSARIGQMGSGRLEIFGGQVFLRQLILGANNNLGFGELYMNGGFLQVLGIGTGPGAGLDSNLVLWYGGDLDGTGTSLTIGDGHDSAVYVAGSFVGHLASVYAGVTPGKLGSWVQSGGTVYVSTNFFVGGCVNGTLGAVTLSGGVLYITNAAHTAIMDVRNGTVTLESGGTLVVDTVVVTNSCGHFINNGGTLVMNNPPVLDPNMDADNTGQSNATKAAAGLDPFDPTSVFKITSVTFTNGVDVLVEWTTQGGHSYVVQTASNLTGTGFQDLSPVIPATGPGPGTATYLDPGGAVGGPRLYRVRLDP
jgi:hypothetical protein